MKQTLRAGFAALAKARLFCALQETSACTDALFESLRVGFDHASENLHENDEAPADLVELCALYEELAAKLRELRRLAGRVCASADASSAADDERDLTIADLVNIELAPAPPKVFA